MEEVTKMKRNIEIVTQHHMGRLLKLKAKANTNEDVGQSSSSPTPSQFYADPNVLKEIDDIVGRIKEVRKRTADIGQPSFDLGISDIDTTPPPPPAPKPIRAKRARK
ncbi:unnamed protein product [Amaranthus hypochondriacus]